MNKLLIFAILATGIFAAETAFACTGTTTVTRLGVCQHCHWTCKTCSGPEADKCTSCHSTPDATKWTAVPDATTPGVCSCKSPNVNNGSATKTWTCGAKTTTDLAGKCPPGTFSIKAGTDYTCEPCTKKDCLNGCINNDATTDKCGDSTGCVVNRTGTTCSTKADAGATKEVPHFGYYTACPEGYWDDSSVCKPLSAGCKAGTSATVCTECKDPLAKLDAGACSCDDAKGGKAKADGTACECDSTKGLGTLANGACPCTDTTKTWNSTNKACEVASTTTTDTTTTSTTTTTTDTTTATTTDTTTTTATTTTTTTDAADGSVVLAFAGLVALIAAF